MKNKLSKVSRIIATCVLTASVGLTTTNILADSNRAFEKINGVCYDGMGNPVEGAITRGYDVSEWNESINWKKVKSSGTDFAFVRISYGTRHLDNHYYENMKNAEAAGVPVGTYIYSLATNVQEALAEAKYAIDKMQGCLVSYPVCFDLEDKTAWKLSRDEVSNMAKAFCDTVRKAGYTPMIYVNEEWYKHKLNLAKLSGIPIWLASYNAKKPAPSRQKYNYTIWQCTDGDSGDTGFMPSNKGKIPGMNPWNATDVNFGFVDYRRFVTPRKYPLAGLNYGSNNNEFPPIENPVINKNFNGWKNELGQTYYYENGIKAKGWRVINNNQYYFHKTQGYMYRNRLVKNSKNQYRYFDSKGIRVKNEFVTIDGQNYFMNSEGNAHKGRLNYKGKVLYFDDNTGIQLLNKKLITKKNNIYYFGSDGDRVHDKFVSLNENGRVNTYYLGKYGMAQKGWLTLNGKRYYFPSRGARMCQRAENREISNKKGLISVFDRNGVCVRQYYK